MRDQYVDTLPVLDGDQLVALLTIMDLILVLESSVDKGEGGVRARQSQGERWRFRDGQTLI
jgi:hypothetical protein